MFQHRHYVKIAAIIAELPEPIREEVALHFTKKLFCTNPKFDAHRFFAAASGNPITGRDKP